VERLWCGSIKRMRIGDSEFTPAKSLWSGGHQRRAVMGWRGEQGRRCHRTESCPDWLAWARTGQHLGCKERAKPDRPRLPPRGASQRVVREKACDITAGVLSVEMRNLNFA